MVRLFKLENKAFSKNNCDTKGILLPWTPPLCLVKLIPPTFCCLEEVAKQSTSSLLFNVLIQIELIDSVLYCTIYLNSEQLIAAKGLQIVMTTPHIYTYCSPLNFFH